MGVVTFNGCRFDLEGWLLPYSEQEITEKSRVLYHHGDEAGRPGYTLQELFQLSRYVLRAIYKLGVDVAVRR